MITIILAVSRADFLERVITAIELLECNKEETNLLCIVDGDDQLYLRTRNLVNDTKFAQRLTVKADLDDNRSRLDVPTRRKRIAAIHNQARELINHTQGYVLSVEDDTTFRPDALQRLLKVATSERAFAMAEGVEIGRWGIPYVGAWKADDVYNLTKLTSIENKQDVTESTKHENIDAGGLYFALIKADLYKYHTFTCENGLGPDVNFGIDNRQLGFENFIVWQVPCVHHNMRIGKYETITPSEKTQTVTLMKEKNNIWKVYT